MPLGHDGGDRTAVARRRRLSGPGDGGDRRHRSELAWSFSWVHLWFWESNRVEELKGK